MFSRGRRSAHVQMCCGSVGAQRDACTGAYSCVASYDLLAFQGGLNEIDLSPKGEDPGTCLVGSDVEASPVIVLEANRTLTHAGTKVGSWTGTGSNLQVCVGSVCTTCTGDGTAGFDQLAPTCNAILGCTKDPPLVALDSASHFNAGKGDAGTCSFSAGGVDVGTFDVNADGTLTADGFPAGTWSGSAASAQICVLGQCSTCSRESGNGDAGSSSSSSSSGDDNQDECESRVDCGGCSTCLYGRCEPCAVGTLGICTC
jgi:hypothetical protein